MEASYHYFCKKCFKHYESGHSKDKEKVFGVCPDCGGNLTLDRHSLSQTVADLALSRNEISSKKVVETIST